MWIRLWIALSLAWAIVLVVLTARLMQSRPDFDAAASEPCPRFILQVFPALEAGLQRVHPRLAPIVVWRDGRSGDDITAPLPDRLARSCTELAIRARLFQVGAKVGLVEPQVHVRTRVLLLVIALSSLLLAPIAWLVHLPIARRRAPARRKGG
jgi:hypothetical protein